MLWSRDISNRGYFRVRVMLKSGPEEDRLNLIHIKERIRSTRPIIICEPPTQKSKCFFLAAFTLSNAASFPTLPQVHQVPWRIISWLSNTKFVTRSAKTSSPLPGSSGTRIPLDSAIGRQIQTTINPIVGPTREILHAARLLTSATGILERVAFQTLAERFTAIPALCNFKQSSGPEDWKCRCRGAQVR
jgi:hypothetical protein